MVEVRHEKDARSESIGRDKARPKPHMTDLAMCSVAPRLLSRVIFQRDHLSSRLWGFQRIIPHDLQASEVIGCGLCLLLDLGRLLVNGTFLIDIQANSNTVTCPSIQR